jgi:hypothetical protein
MDEVDLTQLRLEVEEKLTQRPVYEIPKGNPGECDLCGEWSGRLINGACAPCRDKYEQ